jgi:hypothetical protein
MTQEERLAAARPPSAGEAERIRVVHLIERMAVGGMEKHIEYLLQKLPPDEFQQRLCCMNEPGPRAEEIRLYPADERFRVRLSVRDAAARLAQFGRWLARDGGDPAGWEWDLRCPGIMVVRPVGGEVRHG